MRLQFRHLFPVFLLLCLLLSSIAYAQQRGVKRVEIKTQTGELIGLYEESHALVIGVSYYQDPLEVGCPKPTLLSLLGSVDP